jgi:hypothetical protein
MGSTADNSAAMSANTRQVGTVIAHDETMASQSTAERALEGPVQMGELYIPQAPLALRVQLWQMLARRGDRDAPPVPSVLHFAVRGRLVSVDLPVIACLADNTRAVRCQSFKLRPVHRRPSNGLCRKHNAFVLLAPAGPATRCASSHSARRSTLLPAPALLARVGLLRDPLEVDMRAALVRFR